MVEVEVGDDDVGDGVGVDAERAEPHGCAAERGVDGEDVGLFGAPLVAHARLDEYPSVADVEQQRPPRHADPVARVGRVAPLPDGLGHDAEHGAAVESEAREHQRLELVDGHGWLERVVSRRPAWLRCPEGAKQGECVGDGGRAAGRMEPARAVSP
jgi:hypothetical protein